jgi:hypothetical protein
VNFSRRPGKIHENLFANDKSKKKPRIVYKVIYSLRRRSVKNIGRAGSSARKPVFICPLQISRERFLSPAHFPPIKPDFRRNRRSKPDEPFRKCLCFLSKVNYCNV